VTAGGLTATTASARAAALVRAVTVMTGARAAARVRAATATGRVRKEIIWAAGEEIIWAAGEEATGRCPR
jgi:hypothetical protein